MDNVKMSENVLPAVKKSVSVPLAPQDAFALFTERIHTWWPLVGHSVGGEKAVRCVMEGWAGGRLYEVVDDGSEHDWGQIQIWDPPHRLVTTWHPGRDKATGQRVEVLFEADETGTRVQLTHGDWELLGDRAAEAREGYSQGWDYVLGLFVSRAEGTKDV